MPVEISIPAKMAETNRNGLKFLLRWNRRDSQTDLHTGMRFSGRSDRNGTTLTTMF